MATAARAEEQTAQQAEAQEKDSPLLDLSDAAVKRLIKTAQGARLRDARPAQRRAALRGGVLRPDRGHHVDAVRHGHHRGRERRGGGGRCRQGHSAEDSAEEAEEGSRAVVAPSLPATTSARAEPTDRTDDPVRMYLRDMGSVELLSREGEIAIAKRIEAGREAMIAGLCESPLTFQAIIIWRDELNNAKILLRDIIDLEATYEGPEAKNAPPPHAGRRTQSPRAAAAPAAQANGARRRRRAARPKARWTTRTISRTPCRSRPWRPSSSPRCSRPSTTSPPPTRSCASCRTRSVEMQVASEQFNRASSRRPTTSRATRSSRTSRASRSTTPASRAWSSSSTPSTAPRAARRAA